MTQWRSLSAALLEAQPIIIPRCLADGIDGCIISYTLCGFCDASLGAYAAVVYLLVETEYGHAVKFVASKTQVSPLKRQTIPRLELLSALLLARLMMSISQSLDSEVSLSPPCCFTDSKVALCWICGVDKDWKLFVQNRVAEIRRLLPPDCWRHCQGRDNPTDIPSRGCTPLELSVNKLWGAGPDWLQEGRFGNSDPDLLMPRDCMTEMKAKDLDLVHRLLTATGPSGLSQIMKCEDFSCLDRLLQVTAHVLRFCHILQHKALSRTPEQDEADEMVKAETWWIMESQTRVLRDENFNDWRK